MNKLDLLNEYKKYDYLNSKPDNPLVKIFVSYIKPSFLFKSEILTPIHLGKAVEKDSSKDGIQSNDNLKWLHENCNFNDDFEGGISEHNRRIGFLTGTYWAWKNYEKLGNPEYIGSFGYRRLLNPIFLEKLKNYDLILPKKKDFQTMTIKTQLIQYHGDKLYENMINIFTKIYPEETNNLKNYLIGTSGYFAELYVMKKNIFFDFCQWIFPLVFEYLKHQTIDTIDVNDTRDIAFIMERLTGYYCNKLISTLKFLEISEIITDNSLTDETSKVIMFAKLFRNKIQYKNRNEEN